MNQRKERKGEEMSAFVVSEGCINSIVTYLSAHTADFRRILENLSFDLSSDDGKERFANALFQMNWDAVEQRYGKEKGSGVHSLRFTPTFRPPVAVLKSCSCLCYQCAEGNVPETALFKALEDVSNQIAQRIVRGLPAYDNAPWGD